MTSPLNFEHDQARAEPLRGYRADYQIPLQSFMISPAGTWVDWQRIGGMVTTATDVTPLTDNTGATPDDTIANHADGSTYATDAAAIENNVSDLAAKVNAILGITQSTVYGYEAALNAAGTLAASMPVFCWGATAGGASKEHTIAAVVPLPGEFYQSLNDSVPPELILRVLARKNNRSGSASDNTDLALVCAGQVFSPSAIVATNVASPLTSTFGALASEVFAWKEFNLTQDFSAAERKLLVRDGCLAMYLYPNEAVGTGLQIQIAAATLRMRRHSALGDRSARGSIT